MVNLETWLYYWKSHHHMSWLWSNDDTKLFSSPDDSCDTLYDSLYDSFSPHLITQQTPNPWAHLPSA